MEFKKKTIIWEDNNEPPKDYLWVRSDGKVYEYSYVSKKWVESKYLSTCGGSNSGCNCPGVMIVEGTIDENLRFTPNSGSPSFQDAKSFINRGGIVYLKSPDVMGVPVYTNYDDQDGLFLMHPNYGDPVAWLGTKVFYGSVSVFDDGVAIFRDKDGDGFSTDVVNMLYDGIPVLLSYKLDGETIVDDIVGQDVDDGLHYAYTSRNVRWYEEIS